MKYAIIISLCGTSVGCIVYHFLPIWVFAIFCIINFIGLSLIAVNARSHVKDPAPARRIASKLQISAR